MRPARAALAALLFAAAARADEPSPADVNAARELGKEGIHLADQNKCDEAIDRFARAERLYHAPTILERLGECQVKVGKLVAGIESLQRVVHEPLPDKPPPQFVKARDKAQKLLAGVQGKVAKLKIHVRAPPKVEVAIKIDGEPVSSALVGADRPTDPGEHFVEATAPGYLKSSESVVLKEGGSGEVTLDMKVDPEAPPPKPPEEHAVVAPPPPPPPAPHGGGARVGGIVVLGVGVAGLAVGGIFGAVAIGEKSDLDKRCAVKDQCPPGTQGKIDSANTIGWVSTIGFIAGGACAVAGAAMILFGGGGAPRKAGVVPWIGPGSAGVSGTF